MDVAQGRHHHPELNQAGRPTLYLYSEFEASAQADFVYQGRQALLRLTAEGLCQSSPPERAASQPEAAMHSNVDDTRARHCRFMAPGMGPVDFCRGRRCAQHTGRRNRRHFRAIVVGAVVVGRGLVLAPAFWRRDR
jgi:hypothetical protein